MTFRTVLAVLATTLAGLMGPAQAEPWVKVVERAEVEFIPLNPARGDASPKAGVLWGDIRQDVPSGALITFADGFASPPHIHNITYRAVVIEGTVHNDDPKAENLWMGPGSFWTQPAGEVHITAVGPGGGTAFLEILSGPYLVQPSRQAFDNGERPVNIEDRNVVWLDASDVTWVAQGPGARGPEMAFLWGRPMDGELNGTFVKLPSGYSGVLKTGGVHVKAVLVKGTMTHAAGAHSTARSLTAGSYFGSEGDVAHSLSCGDAGACVVYVRAAGKYQVVDAN